MVHSWNFCMLSMLMGVPWNSVSVPPSTVILPKLLNQVLRQKDTYRHLSHQYAVTTLGLLLFPFIFLTFPERFRDFCQWTLLNRTGQSYQRLSWYHCRQISLVDWRAEWHLPTKSLLLERVVTDIVFELFREDPDRNKIPLIFLSLVLIILNDSTHLSQIIRTLHVLLTEHPLKINKRHLIPRTCQRIALIFLRAVELSVISHGFSHGCSSLIKSFSPADSNCTRGK